MLSMIVKFDMALTFPTGCGFKLRLEGKEPLKPWRIVTTHARLAVELSKRTCRHPAGHKHDRLEGSIVNQSGFYNRSVATTIKHVPSMPVVPRPEGPVVHNPREGLLYSALAGISGMVTLALTRKEMLSNPKAPEAVKAARRLELEPEKYGTTAQWLSEKCCAVRPTNRVKPFMLQTP